jgi:tellurite resistance protein
MTPNEFNVVKSLVVVAWADGTVAAPERNVIEGLLCAFDATPDEERELLDFAAQRRTLLEDLPLGDLSPEDRELLLANAALLTHADGVQSASEKRLLAKLVDLLELGEHAETILESAKDGALQLGSKVLSDAQ